MLSSITLHNMSGFKSAQNRLDRHGSRFFIEVENDLEKPYIFRYLDANGIDLAIHTGSPRL
jgi:hypothetical protein